MLDLEGRHWTFALAVYGEGEVAQHCLVLQDRYGVDVNLLLMGAYAALSGKVVTPETVAGLDAAIAPWRTQIISPLRAVRRQLKTGPAPAPSRESDALRRDIQAAEIKAEQAVQAVLAGIIDGLPAGATPVGDAIVHVIAHAIEARGDNVAQTLPALDIRTAVVFLIQACVDHAPAVRES